jgi:hypothetical protein
VVLGFLFEFWDDFLTNLRKGKGKKEERVRSVARTKNDITEELGKSTSSSIN